jgi:ankyrin repeat protein
MLERSQSLKRANTSSTLYGHEAKFDFDEKVVSSRAYRRAFQHFLRQSRSDCKLRAVDKEPDLTDTDTASIHPISHRTIAADGGSEVEIVKRSENIQLLKQHNEVNLIELDDTSSLSPDCVIPNPKAITHCKSVGDLSTPPDLALGYSWWDQTAASSVHIAPNFSRFVTCPTLPTPSSVDSGIQSERPTTQPSPRAFDLLGSSSLDRSVERSRIESQPSQSSCQTTMITQRSKTAAGDASHSTGSAIQAYGSRVEHKQLDLLSPRDPYKMLGVAAGSVGSWTPQRETVNSQSQWELNTFLRSAVDNGHVASLETLLRKGADIEASDENGNRALHIAALKGCTEVVETLLRSGADKEAPCETGDRPLHLATHQGHLATVDALLKSGAQIHANGHGMYSPLHYAANGGHIEIVELLLRNGANTLAMNQAGQLPVDLAKIHGHDHVIELLVKRQQHKPDVRSEGHMVASLYQPGFEFASRVNWPQAKQKGLDRRKSLLVNIQDSSILTCQALNRDLWSDLRVQDEIKRRFVFLQYAKNDPNGAQYIQQHFRAYDRQDAYPHIAIVDPRTGKHTSIWGGPPVPSVNEFLSQLYKFRDRYS